MFVFPNCTKTYYYLLTITQYTQKQIHVHFHARNTCKINHLLAHLNDTTIQLKFSTYRSQNFSQKYLLLRRLPNISFLALYFDKIALPRIEKFFHVYWKLVCHPPTPPPPPRSFSQSLPLYCNNVINVFEVNVTAIAAHTT